LAGSGRKVFSAGAVLSANDVQNYLQDQAVMVFATTSDRTTALTLGTASVASEGMVSYIKNVDQIQVFNGVTWIPQAYAQAAGTANSTTGALAAGSAATVNVDYPSGRFSVAPIIQAWSASNRYIVSATTNTAGSAVLSVRNVSDAAGSDSLVYWTAVQMTSGTAAG
jgi:hypothetical protein